MIEGEKRGAGTQRILLILESLRVSPTHMEMYWSKKRQKNSRIKNVGVGGGKMQLLYLRCVLWYHNNLGLVVSLLRTGEVFGSRKYTWTWIWFEVVPGEDWKKEFINRGEMEKREGRKQRIRDGEWKTKNEQECWVSCFCFVAKYLLFLFSKGRSGRFVYFGLDRWSRVDAKVSVWLGGVLTCLSREDIS